MDKTLPDQPGVPSPHRVEGLSIAAVERDTGLSKDTLRVWERRYGFPEARRGELGERLYTQEVVGRLRLLKRLTDAGYRPGRLMKLSLADLQRLVDEAGGADEAADAGPQREVAACIAAVLDHDVAALGRQLRQVLLRRGLGVLVHQAVIPLLRLVGDAWMRGRLEVYQEHMVSEQLHGILHEALRALPEPAAQARPRVLLATFPGEPHGLSILLAQVLCAAEGAACVSLGTQTPLWDLVLAAKAYRADIVLLGFSGCSTPSQVIDGLAELRAKLPPGVDLWAGGSSPVLKRRPPPGVAVIPALDRLAPRLQEWRDAQVPG